MLTSIKLRDFRCFEQLECEFAPGLNLFVGPNAQGKTSLLEAVCVLARLQSPRTSALREVIKRERVGLVVDGYFNRFHLQFYYASRRKKLALDSVEQKKATQYLESGRVVWFGNPDLELVRGSADIRRRYLDFMASQMVPGYRQQLRTYERALRSRNALLKQPRVRWREVEAFEQPLLTAGNFLTEARARLVTELSSPCPEAHRRISSSRETLTLEYQAGSGADFAQSLAAARDADARLRQTTVGPHRDELVLTIDGHPASQGSEGQQRTIALALRLGESHCVASGAEHPPILLIDDVFGELDPQRRNALLQALPAESQKLITTTHLDWLEAGEANVRRIQNATLERY